MRGPRIKLNLRQSAATIGKVIIKIPYGALPASQFEIISHEHRR
jgi:hypothetical protein